MTLQEFKVLLLLILFAIGANVFVVSLFAIFSRTFRECVLASWLRKREEVPEGTSHGSAENNLSAKIRKETPGSPAT